MKRFSATLYLCLLFSPLAGVAQTATPTPELIVCGRDEVFILDLKARDAAGTPQKIWSWTAAGRDDLPAEYHSLFRSTDECKPVNGGSQILITSSGGAFALVDRQKQAVLGYGRAVNAHSADLLPQGRVAVAASRDPRGSRGDSLILFDITQPGRELWRGELPSGHGVVWDPKRQVVWALADQEIKSYRLTDWSTPAPKLTLIGTFVLPESGGHDLQPVPDTAMLSVTTSNHCWYFDRDRTAIFLHPALGEHGHVKSITQHPVTRQLAYTQADQPNWWTTRIQFLGPNEALSVPGEEFYKVRWNVSVE